MKYPKPFEEQMRRWPPLGDDSLIEEVCYLYTILLSTISGWYGVTQSNSGGCCPWPEGDFPEEGQEEEMSSGKKGDSLDFWSPLPVAWEG